MYGSFMYPESTGPQYVPGESADEAVSSLVICSALFGKTMPQRESRKLEKMEMEMKISCAET